MDKFPEFYAANEPTEEVFRKRKPEKPATPKPKTPPPPAPKPKTPPPPKPKTPPPPKPETPPPPKHEAPLPKPQTPEPEPVAKPKTPEPEPEPAAMPQPKEAERRKRDDWVPKRNKVKIHNSLDYNFKHNKMEFDYKKKEGNFQKVTNHDFKWSEEYKARQGKSVFDRWAANFVSSTNVKSFILVALYLQKFVTISIVLRKLQPFLSVLIRW